MFRKNSSLIMFNIRGEVDGNDLKELCIFILKLKIQTDRGSSGTIAMEKIGEK